MGNDSYNVGVGRVILALLAAGGITLGGWTIFTGGGVFNAATAPSGEAAKTKVWHDSTTKKFMADVAASGAKYFVMSPTSDTGGGGGLSGLTTNKVMKATAADAIGDSRITDTGTGEVTVGAPSLSIQDSNASHKVILTPGDETGDRVLSIPVLGAAAKVNISSTTQTNGYLQQATADGVLANATNTDTDVADSVTKRHTQNTDTGTTSNTFTVDSDSTTGKIVIDVALGAADKTLTVTNAALTDNRTVTIPDATGKVNISSTTQTAGRIQKASADGVLKDTLLDCAALTPDAALTKWREDLRKEADSDKRMSQYAQLREMQTRVQTIKARNANGAVIPSLSTALSAEKAKAEVKLEAATEAEK